MKKISKLRKIALDQIEQVQAQTQIEYDGYSGQDEHRIQAIYNGEEIGYLTFSEKGNDTISIDDGQVSSEYEGYDIEELLLDRFGYILEGDYPNFIVESHFNSPEFENTFRRLVGQGLIPSNALDNTRVTRNYDEEAQMRHQDYQDSLPDSIKAKRNSRLKKSHLAIRNVPFMKDLRSNTGRDYNEADEELWYNELEPKLKDLRRQKGILV